MVLLNRLTLLVLLLPVTGIVAAQNIDLQQLEQMALNQDTLLKSRQVMGDAFREQAVSRNTLPDPKVRLALLNFPTDTFRRDQEPMTQILLGVKQALPRGDTLEIRSRQAVVMGREQDFLAEDRRLSVLKKVRTVYLEYLYWQKAEEIILESKKLFAKLRNITRAHYASGARQQQDVIRSELELSLLDDRLDEIHTRQASSRAELLSIVGDELDTQRLSQQIPQLPVPRVQNNRFDIVKEHPMIRSEDEKVEYGQQDIALARQSYKPGWTFELSYGIRDGVNPNGRERPDFLTAGVSFDVPLFTKNKQDRDVAASRLRYQSKLHKREDKLRKMLGDYDAMLATWNKQAERLARYKAKILPDVQSNAKAYLYAYQNRRSDFDSLMRSQILELETRLKYSRLQINQLKTQAGLLYLAGERQ